MKAKNYYNFLSKRLMATYATYIVIFTVVTYILCTMYIQNDYKRTESEYATEITKSVENHLLYTSRITSALGADDDVKNFFDASPDDNRESTIRLVKTVANTRVFGGAKSDLVLVNPNLDIAVTHAGSMSVDYIENIYGLERGSLKLKAEKMNHDAIYTELIFNNADNTKNVSDKIITTSICYTDLENPMIYMVCTDAREIFENANDKRSSRIVDLNVEKDNFGISYHLGKENKFLLGNNEKHRGYISVASHTVQNSLWGDIKCSVFVPILPYYLHINRFIILILIFVGLLSFVGYIYMKKKTVQIYGPINKMLTSLFRDADKYEDEFEEVNKLFSSLESQKNVMSEIIFNNQIQLRDRFLNQLITSTLTRKQIKCELVTHNLEEVTFPGVACIISYKNFDEIKSILTVDGLGEVRDAIKDFFEQYFEKANFIEITDIDQENFCAIICPQHYEWLENQLRKCVLNIEAVLDINMVVFMGKKADSWYDIPASYAEALKLKDKSRIISSQGIVISKTDNEDTISLAYTAEQERELINYVFQNNRNMMFKCLSDVVNSNLNDNNYLPHEHFSHFVTMIYSTVIKILSRINKTEKEVFAPMSVYLELMNCNTAEKFTETATAIFDTLINNIQDIEKTSITTSSEHIISYVNNHYHEDISLYSLAEYLNMSQSYASRIFKQTTGENFKDYLTNVRLGKALEFMNSDPYVKLNDVAKKVGYTSETFTRAFAKKYNVTPSEYMKNNNK